MRYQVCIEYDPAGSPPPQPKQDAREAEEAGRLCPTRAWVPALPGCFCEASSEAEAMARMPIAIAEYLAWLRSHGEAPAQDDECAVEVVERVEAPSGRSERVFSADRAPATEEDIQQAIRLMSYARADLYTLVSPLPERVLSWQPTPDKWNIRGILAHIASADCYYRTSLLDEQPELEPPRELFDLALQRERAIAHLRSLTKAQRAQLFHPNWPWRADADEEWTVRKALRRFIYHERFHTRDIQQTLAWLVTGGPSHG